MNSFINDIFEKMGSETADLARYNKKVRSPCSATSRLKFAAVCCLVPDAVVKKTALATPLTDI